MNRKVLVVYDSWFGNTLKIAKAIAGSLTGDVNIQSAKRAWGIDLARIELLVVGSPTHGGVATPDMQDFLNSLSSDEMSGIVVAAFDTRVRYKWLSFIGFASKRIAKVLQNKGGVLLSEPVGFYVKDKKGPLMRGELMRAKAWGAQLESAANAINLSRVP
jgi:flavodoxin